MPGVDLRLGAPVSRVDVGGAAGAVRVDAGGSSLAADLVLSTLPLARLAGLVAPAAPLEVALAADRLRHRGLVLAYLVLDRPRWTEFDAHYFPDLDVPLARLSEPKNYRDDPTDPADVTVLCAEIPCTVGDDVWTATPDDLGARVAEALLRMGLPDATPAAVEVRRLPRVYPLLPPRLRVGPGHRRAVARRAAPRSSTLGRQGLFVPRQHPPRPRHGLGRGRRGPVRPGRPLGRGGVGCRSRALPHPRGGGLTSPATT